LREERVVGHLKLRLLACAAIVGLTALGASSIAGANTIFGTQDPTVTVSSTLKSSGADPEVARAGDTVFASVTMDSNIDTASVVRTTVWGDLDGTRFSFDRSKIRKLRADGTWDWAGKLTIKAGTPPGTYHLGIQAVTVGSFNESLAVATITVVG
jgi:hypothetical protein